MSKPITITGTVAVWLYSFNRPTDLLEAIEKGNTRQALGMLSYYGSPDSASFGEHTRVGEADVTVRLLPRDEQTRIAVEALNKKLEKLRAAYLTAQQEVYEQITKLQALTNEVTQ